MPQILWNEPHNDEGDRHGSTFIVGASYWEVGVSSDDTWSALLIHPDGEGYDTISQNCLTAREAMAAAEKYEAAHAAL